MALITLGTNGTTTLNALAWNPQAAAADIASIVNNIKSQPNTGTFQRISPGAFAQNGRLHFPGRLGSFINLRPGDYIAYDGAGWPIVVSAFSIANGGGWTHS
jgi:hypothetical protein